MEKEQMNVVIVGHVDHGKSTLIGRLLADTGSLPKGKLEAVKEHCRKTAKPFEYAFLLDALKDEQAQGITIDTARSFFKSKKRDYIIIDAPGHIEFLKNMITGAARAEAAMLVIDAKEGIRENSKRHGYMMSFLGIKNVAVCVNKMDLVNFDEKTFERIKKEYTAFLKEINLVPPFFIPISAREGDNIAAISKNMTWYKEQFVLEALDAFTKAAPKDEQPFRFPVQDIYKFTEEDDERRIVAGRVESGTVKAGDEVVFFPSGKSSRVSTIESFATEVLTEAFAGQATGFTLETQVYIKPGEIMAKRSEKKPHVATKFRANIFWMGRTPLVKGKTYKLKVAAAQVPVLMREIISVLDASELSSIKNKPQVDRHDVAECVLETLKPVSFDEVTSISETGRFVIVDNYEISGGGIILAPVFEEGSALGAYIKEREFRWERSDITASKRSKSYKHKSLFVVITGEANTGKIALAKRIERELFEKGRNAYFLGITNEALTSTITSTDKTLSRIQYIRQIGELAHVLTDAGLILLSSISDIDEHDLKTLKALNHPNRTLVVHVGETPASAQQTDLFIKLGTNLDEAFRSVIALIENASTLDPEFTI